jgi:hypothetical protein
MSRLPNHAQDQEAHASQLGERHLFFLVDDFGLECGPSYALATKQAVPTDDRSVPGAIKTLSLAPAGRSAGVLRWSRGQWLVPALAVRQRRVAQGNQPARPLQWIFTARTTDAVHAGRWYQVLSVRAANTPRRGTARPPGSVGGRRSGQGRTRAPAEHRHRASGIARRRGTHPSPDRRTSPEKAARRQSCAPLPRQPPNQQHGKDDQ